MNTLSILLLGLMMIACGKTENAFDTLSEAEKDFLRIRAQQKCNAERTPTFENFKADSSQALFEERAFERHVSYKVTSTVAGTTGKQELTLQIWKQANDYVIFYVNSTGTPITSYFLRLTKAQNDQMIDQLKEDFCSRAPAIFQPNATVGDNGPITFAIKYDARVTPGKATEFTDTFRIAFSQPVFFANFNISRSELTRNIDVVTGQVDDDNSHATTVTFKSTLAAGDLGRITQAYTNDRVFTQRFCELTAGTSGKFRVESNNNSFGYLLPVGTACPTTKPNDWDMTVTDI